MADRTTFEVPMPLEFWGVPPQDVSPLNRSKLYSDSQDTTGAGSPQFYSIGGSTYLQVNRRQTAPFSSIALMESSEDLPGSWTAELVPFTFNGGSPYELTRGNGSHHAYLVQDFRNGNPGAHLYTFIQYGSTTFDPTDTGLIYATTNAQVKTALGTLVAPFHSSSGAGLLRSTDGGLTWTLGGLFNNPSGVALVEPAVAEFDRALLMLFRNDNAPNDSAPFYKAVVYSDGTDFTTSTPSLISGISLHIPSPPALLTLKDQRIALVHGSPQSDTKALKVWTTSDLGTSWTQTHAVPATTENDRDSNRYLALWEDSRHFLHIAGGEPDQTTIAQQVLAVPTRNYQAVLLDQSRTCPFTLPTSATIITWDIYLEMVGSTGTATRTSLRLGDGSTWLGGWDISGDRTLYPAAPNGDITAISRYCRANQEHRLRLVWNRTAQTVKLYYEDVLKLTTTGVIYNSWPDRCYIGFNESGPTFLVREQHLTYS